MLEIPMFCRLDVRLRVLLRLIWRVGRSSILLLALGSLDMSAFRMTPFSPVVASLSLVEELIRTLP